MISKLSDRLLSAYGRFVPYHPGQWRVVRAFEPLARKTWSGARRRIVRDGVLYDIDMRNLCARYLCYSGTYEVNETRYLKQQVKPGDVAIDVGSHIGYFALLFSRLVGPQGMVYACEPDPSMFKEVLKNLTLNNIKNVDALELALGDHDGTVGMAGSAGNDTGNYHIVPTGTIPLETLDHFAERKNIKRVDWIKADIEGAEVGMLRGGRATLLKWRPRLILELNPEGLTQMGTSADELISELSKTGYELFQAHRTGLERFSRIPPMGEHINLIAIPRSRSYE